MCFGAQDQSRQSLTWSTAYWKSIEYSQKGDYKTAITYAEQAVRQAEKEFGKEDHQLTLVLEQLASLYSNQRFYAKAEPLLKRILAIDQKTFGTDHPDVATSLYSLATLYEKQGRYAEAEPLFRRALAIEEKAHSADQCVLASYLEDLARVYAFEGRFANAEPLLKRALVIEKKAHGADHPDVATALSDLATLYQAQIRYAEAEPLLKRALAIGEKTHGADHSYVASHLEHLGSLYLLEGRLADAEPLFKRALAIEEKAHGASHSVLASCLEGLASVYTERANYAEAESLYKRALVIAENTDGADSSEVGIALWDLAALCEKQGRYTEAELLFKRALAIEEKALGADRFMVPRCLNSLATLYVEEAHYAEAEPLYKRAIKIAENFFGVDHRDVAAYLGGLASLCELQGRYSEAEPLFKRALAINEKALGVNHPQVAMTLENLAMLYEHQNRYTEAEPLFKRAVAIEKIAHGPDHPDVLLMLNNLALSYLDQGRYAEAEPIFERGLAIDEQALRADHPVLATTLTDLGMLYLFENRYAEAEPLLKRALAIFEKVLGTDHPHVALLRDNLGLLYEDQDRYAEAEEMYLSSRQTYLRRIAKDFPSLSEREKTAFYRTLQTSFEGFDSFALRRMPQNPLVLGTLFNNQLDTKALLLRATTKVSQRIRESRDSLLIGKYNSWNERKEYLAKVYTLSIDERSAQAIRLDSLEQDANELEKELSEKSEQFAEEFDRKPVTWQDVKSTLHDGEAAIEIIRIRHFDKQWTDTVSYAALIVTTQTKDHPDIVVLQNGNELETVDLQRYRMSVKNHDSTKDSYDHYWARIAEKLKGIERIYISSDGVFNLINLATLQLPDGRFLLDTQDLRLVTNTRDLVGYRRSSSGQNQRAVSRADIFGRPDYSLEEGKQLQLAASYQPRQRGTNVESASLDSLNESVPDLPGTEVEVEGISKILQNHQWQVKTYLWDDALEEAVKAVESPRVLHIATHGYFEEDVSPTKGRGAVLKHTSSSVDLLGEMPERNPLLRSGLLFAGAGRKQSSKVASRLDDGILTAYEAMNLNLDSTELVVLSACETGLGEVKNGEGVYGLQRAFQVAGARTVMMSLWSVADEETQELMRMFYEKWLSGKDKHTAFREAQMEMKAKYSFPDYWGAFVMVGE